MRWLKHFEEVLIIVLMAAMTVVTFMQVVARYVFNYSFVWALELTGVIFAWLIFVGMSYGVRVGAHIGVDAVVRIAAVAHRAHRRRRRGALCLVYAGIVTVGGFQYVRKMYDVGILMQDMPIAAWIPRAILPIGFALLAFRFLQVLINVATGKEAHLLGDEAKEALKLKVDDTDGGGHDHRVPVPAAVRLHADRHAGGGRRSGLSSPADDPVLRAGLAGIAVAQAVRDQSEHYTLLAIPFFILAGAFMTTGGVAKRMIRFANRRSRAPARRPRHGLACWPACCSRRCRARRPATVVAIGSIVIAGMVQAGYPQPFAAGVICNAGTLGHPDPAVDRDGGLRRGDRNVGGQAVHGRRHPRRLLGLMLMVAIYVRARMIGMPKQPRAPLTEVLQSGRDSMWGLLLVIIILGGIYGGVFTPTEAAAVAAVYAFFIAVFVYRDIGPRQVPHVLLEAGKVTVMLMFIVANALLFAHVLTTERIPQAIAEAILGWGMADWQFLVVVNILLLVAGMFMEPTGIILILAPILFPIAIELGIDPMHLGHHHGREPGDRHDHAADRAQPVRDGGHHQDVDHAGGARGAALDDGPAAVPRDDHLHPGDHAVPAEPAVLARRRRARRVPGPFPIPEARITRLFVPFRSIRLRASASDSASGVRRRDSRAQTSIVSTNPA